MRYTDPSQFEPLLPQKHLNKLFDLSRQIIESSARLRAGLHHTTATALSALLREMNSYYSNKIEGHSTHPLNIARGLRHDFSDKPDVAKLQRLAIAHIDAECEIESWVNSDPNFSPFSAEGVRRIHEALYNKLSVDDRLIENGRIVEAGKWRELDVQVGQHLPPIYTKLSDFLTRYEKFYAVPTSYEKQLLMIGSAHHRLTWIHPFIDGNGRVARLATQAALYRDFTGGLWSVCRGFARTKTDYYAKLELADQLRQDNFDGRGNLTEKGLWQFCEYFLTVCLDQINFICKLLDLNGMRQRIRAFLIFQSQIDKRIRQEAELPLHYLFSSGSLTRAEFKQMTGLGDKVAQMLLSHLLKTGLVKSDSPLGSVYFGLPLDALSFYFPDLYPEANRQLDD